MNAIEYKNKWHIFNNAFKIDDSLLNESFLYYLFKLLYVLWNYRFWSSVIKIITNTLIKLFKPKYWESR